MNQLNATVKTNGNSAAKNSTRTKINLTQETRSLPLQTRWLHNVHSSGNLLYTLVWLPEGLILTCQHSNVACLPVFCERNGQVILQTDKTFAKHALLFYCATYKVLAAVITNVWLMDCTRWNCLLKTPISKSVNNKIFITSHANQRHLFTSGAGREVLKVFRLNP